jgi:hypothetical protein
MEFEFRDQMSKLFRRPIIFSGVAIGQALLRNLHELSTTIICFRFEAPSQSLRLKAFGHLILEVWTSVYILEREGLTDSNFERLRPLVLF